MPKIRHKNFKASTSDRLASVVNNFFRSRVTQVSIEDLTPKDAIVAIMGPTGAGKSSFIEMATGIEGIVGHTLESKTNEISVIKLSFPGIADSDICFVDTPGFDDTNKSDVQIFKMISDWLNNTYKRHIQLTGLLYFHRVTDNRMAGTTLKNLKLFEKLCGENFNNIVLTTTMWGEVEEEEGDRREKELENNYWKAMIERGSSVKRFLYTRESAFDVLKPILEEVNNRNAVLLQKEMNDLNMQIKETSAGKTLYLELEDLVSRQQTILGKIRADLHESKLEPDQLQFLMEEYGKVSAQLQRATEDLKKMKISVGERIQNFARRIDWTRMFSIFSKKKPKTPTKEAENGQRNAIGTTSPQQQVGLQPQNSRGNDGQMMDNQGSEEEDAQRQRNAAESRVSGGGGGDDHAQEYTAEPKVQEERMKGKRTVHEGEEAAYTDVALTDQSGGGSYSQQDERETRQDNHGQQNEAPDGGGKPEMPGSIYI